MGEPSRWTPIAIVKRVAALCLFVFVMTGTAASARQDVPEARNSKEKSDSHDVSPAKLIHTVQPVYPKEAKEQHIKGVVMLHATIAKDGSVQDIQAISGPDLLRQPAIDAVKQWRYRPLKVKGEPKDVETEIQIIF